ncbi:ATP synthase F0 subunit A [Candidatus Nomurabacteria bacterium RIFCSPLOWO2_02_FULL_42_17]|uniref:ATP synthase subunit a n=2 Tax=Candidatus Nomuraibacteriota TaxID=1752729 RepID=A0A1F6WHF5_9BACT|nr:MAG: ATP synthase subunit a [Parcubacteria group bacterium GW2011_GWA2_42_18]OGI81333.1 MAG: ATP synthase F0 subunit A [Candidatus Nomurabacteria bacterium RIFCSPHIGHO2_02_FULL_42_24]OGI97372.1 MAG: ATP synthase F0 subunit A [Candidatus Nomurabacteria bacterium RIFCSPLOWO2_02_FULL_42_17]
MTEIIHEPTVFAEPIFHLGSMTVTNSLLASMLAVLVLVIIGICLRFSLKNVPRGLQNVFETILEGALNLCDQVTGHRRLSLKILPIALTIFLFVLVNNWLGLLPGVGTIGQIRIEEGHSIFVPYLRGGTADINTTLALGIFSVLGANIFGIFSVGLWKTFNKYINLKILGSIFTKVRREPTILVVAPVQFFVGLVETIGEFAKIASLSFRLFGNIFAGEVLLASLGALIAYAVPIPFIFLEILVGLIQALVFSMLTVVYFTIAAENH